MRTSPLPLLLALLLGGCVNLAPDYQRPAAPVAAQWPGAAPAGASQADVDWREFFVDARLRDTVARALANNRDLRVAALNVEYQRAQYRIQRAELFPAVSASAEGTRQRALSDGTTAVSSQYSVGLGVSSYELDLFGRLRNLKDAALEDYLAHADLQVKTSRTVCTPEGLRASIAEIRRQGWVIIDQELEMGLRSVAVPLKDSAGQVLAALNVGTHVGRVSRQELETRFLPVLLEASRELSTRLFH